MVEEEYVQQEGKVVDGEAKIVAQLERTLVIHVQDDLLYKTICR